MKDPVKLKELIVEKLDLADVMLSYKVKFAYNPHLVKEVQFKCPVHGSDNKPSARLYNDTKSCFCWVCRKSWDVVSFVMEMEQLTFRKAVAYLLNRYNIDDSSVPDEPELKTVVSKFDHVVSDLNLLRCQLLDLRKKIPFDKYRALCFGFLMVEKSFEKGVDVTESIHKIGDKIVCLSQQ